MLSFQLHERITRIRAAISQARDLHDLTDRVCQFTQPIEDALYLAAHGGDKANAALPKFPNLFSDLRQSLRATTRIRSIIIAIESFKEALSTVETEPPSLLALTGIFSEIERFAACYEEFVNAQYPPTAMRLHAAARDLRQSLSVLDASLHWVSMQLQQTDLHEDREEVSLILPQPMNFKEFTRKLNAIGAIYEELSVLLDVSLVDEPLRIRKVESGSLWVRLAGNPVVIGMMVKFVTAVAGFIFRRFTTEGQLESLPRKMELIEEVMRFTDRLAERGVDTNKMREHIEKSAYLVTRDLNRLLDGQPSVTINGETVSIANEYEKAITQKLPLRLGFRDNGGEIGRADRGSALLSGPPHQENSNPPQEGPGECDASRGHTERE